MKKKNRTGLQSKVSHIFAGVPIPKKKRSRSGPEQEPETKDTQQTPDIQFPADEPLTLETQKQIEATPDEEKADTPQAEEQVIKQPPMIELPGAIPSIPLRQTIGPPEINEHVEAVHEPFPGKSVKAGITKQKVAKTRRKTSIRSKDKRSASKAGPSSRKQTTMVILVIALSVLLFFLLFKPFSKSSHNITGPGASQPAGSQLVSQASAANIKINWQIPDVYPTNIRDPMILGSQQQFYSETWKPNLVGLVYNEEQKYAIIGTELLQEGEEINGVKVLKINKDSVEFEKDGQKWTQVVQGENN